MTATTPVSTRGVALFADVQNLYYTARDAFGRYIDYTRLWQEIVGQAPVTVANAYAIERHDPRQQKFQRTLREIGFNVRLKPFIQRRDGSAKGDWDVGITLDMVEAAEHTRRLVLLSGDGDFAELIERLQTRFEARVEVYGVASLTARALSRAADSFTPIDERFLLPPRGRSPATE